MSSYIEVPPDKMGCVKFQKGKMIFWYDELRDEVVIQTDAKGTMIVRPRAGNSVAITTEKS